VHDQQLPPPPPPCEAPRAGFVGSRGCWIWAAVALLALTAATCVTVLATARSKGEEAFEQSVGLRDASTLWSVAGGFRAVAADGQAGVVYACEGSELVSLSGEGLETGRAGLSLAPARMLCAEFDGAPGKELLITDRRRALSGLGPTGSVLWTYDAPGDVCDVGVGDLDGDGRDEVAIAAAGHLAALDDDGRLLWQTTSMGDVISACIASVGNGGRPAVAAIASDQTLVAWSATGTRERTAGPQMRQFVRPLAGDPTAQAITLCVLAVSPPDRSVLTFGLWAGDLCDCGGGNWLLEGGAPVWSADTSTKLPWLAIGTMDGEVRALEQVYPKFWRPRQLARFRTGPSPEVAWLDQPSATEPTLVMADGGSVTAYRLE